MTLNWVADETFGGLNKAVLLPNWENDATSRGLATQALKVGVSTYSFHESSGGIRALYPITSEEILELLFGEDDEEEEEEEGETEQQVLGVLIAVVAL